MSNINLKLQLPNSGIWIFLQMDVLLSSHLFFRVQHPVVTAFNLNTINIISRFTLYNTYLTQATATVVSVSRHL